MAKSEAFRAPKNPYAQNNAYMSGTSLQVMFENIGVGYLNTISVSVVREKAPIYVIGYEQPISFSRGKRGIAGTLNFAVLDRHAFYDIMYGAALSGKGGYATYGAKITNLNSPGFKNPGVLSALSKNLIIDEDSEESSIPNIDIYGTEATTGSELPYRITGANASDENAHQIGVAERVCQYADQIMPFSITVCSIPETGHMAVARVYGVELINMSTSISTDDVAIMEGHSYIAQDYVGFQPQPYLMDSLDDSNFNRYITFGRAGSESTNRPQSIVGGVPGNSSIHPFTQFVD